MEQKKVTTQSDRRDLRRQVGAAKLRVAGSLFMTDV